jgi:hypothetical protein
MGELEEAIREHLELKRRRGADPAEVAREEQDALAPVTRSHPVVTAFEEPPPSAEDEGPGANGDAVQEPAAEPEAREDPADATQEFAVNLGDDWLEEESA